jgi:hypothetical protein
MAYRYDPSSSHAPNAFGACQLPPEPQGACYDDQIVCSRGIKALFCRIWVLFWRITGKACVRGKEVAENSDFVGFAKVLMAAENLFRGTEKRFFPVLPVEQRSGPSIARAETRSRKVALFGDNRRAWGGTHSGSAPSIPPFVAT